MARAYLPDRGGGWTLRFRLTATNINNDGGVLAAGRRTIVSPNSSIIDAPAIDTPTIHPPLLLITPPPAADNAHYFRVAPNNRRVVTNVDHNVHTILDPKNCHRALLTPHSATWVKAPLTLVVRRCGVYRIFVEEHDLHVRAHGRAFARDSSARRHRAVERPDPLHGLGE